MKKPVFMLLLAALVIFLCACGNTYKIKVVGAADQSCWGRGFAGFLPQICESRRNCDG